jgi:hypothetical protein
MCKKGSSSRLWYLGQMMRGSKKPRARGMALASTKRVASFQWISDVVEDTESKHPWIEYEFVKNVGCTEICSPWCGRLCHSASILG